MTSIFTEYNYEETKGPSYWHIDDFKQKVCVSQQMRKEILPELPLSELDRGSLTCCVEILCLLQTDPQGSHEALPIQSLKALNVPSQDTYLLKMK